MEITKQLRLFLQIIHLVLLLKRTLHILLNMDKLSLSLKRVFIFMSLEGTPHITRKEMGRPN